MISFIKFLNSTKFKKEKEKTQIHWAKKTNPACIPMPRFIF